MDNSRSPADSSPDVERSATSSRGSRWQFVPRGSGRQHPPPHRRLERWIWTRGQGRGATATRPTLERMAARPRRARSGSQRRVRITQPLRDCPQSPGRLVALQGCAGWPGCRVPAAEHPALDGEHRPELSLRRGQLAAGAWQHGEAVTGGQGVGGVPRRMPERQSTV
jgi:hypothetical protein